MAEIPVRCTRCNQGTSYLHFDPETAIAELMGRKYWCKDWCPTCGRETTFTPRFP